MMSAPQKTSGPAGTRSGALVAFTLIEVLAVIGVITVLAALCLPILKGTIVRAGTAKDIQGIHQVGIALQSYAQDNTMLYPPVAVGNPSVPWCRDPLDPYLPKKNASENGVFVGGNAKPRGGGVVRRAYSAGGAMYGFYNGSPVHSGLPRNVMTIQNPGKAVLVFDGVVSSSGLCQDGTTWSEISVDLGRTEPGEMLYIDYRHAGRAQFLFADLHIEALSPREATSALPNLKTYGGTK